MAETALRRTKPSKRDAIVAIAKELFLREGYSATSMATLAARLGGSKTTLYNHFPSKEDLLRAVVAQMSERTGSAFVALDLEHGDLQTALINFGKAMVQVAMSDDTIAMHRLIAAEAERFPELGQAYYKAGVSTAAEKLGAALERAMAAGRLRRRNAVIAAHHFMHMCLSDPHQRQLWNIGPRPSEMEIEANIVAAVEDFLNGYGAPETAGR